MTGGCCEVSERMYVAACEGARGDVSPEVGAGIPAAGSCGTFLFCISIAVVSCVPPGYVLLLWVCQGEEKWGFLALKFVSIGCILCSRVFEEHDRTRAFLSNVGFM